MTCCDAHGAILKEGDAVIGDCWADGFPRHGKGVIDGPPDAAGGKVPVLWTGGVRTEARPGDLAKAGDGVMKTFEGWQWMPDNRARSMTRDEWRTAYDNYCQRTAQELEAAISDLEADNAAYRAATSDVKGVLAKALRERGVDASACSALEAAQTAASMLKTMEPPAG